jgi:hypothetical protein
MSGLRASQVPGARDWGGTVSAWLLGGVVALLFALPASASAADITFIAPSGARTYPAAPRGAVSDNPVLGEYQAAGRTRTFTASQRLRLFGAARQALRHARSLGLVLAAGEPDKILAGLADDSLSYQVLILHR